MTSAFFSKIKDIVWPIENRELPKFLPMAFMMMCILFNYALLRSIKDSLLVVNIGAEAISFAKILVVPSSILAMIFYSKLCNIMNTSSVFYSINACFIAYFVLFVFLLPNADAIHPSKETIDAVVASYPMAGWFIKVVGSWIYTSFYIMSELWGSLMVSLLFWQFANSITSTAEAKRFYAMFGLLGNIGLIIAGDILKLKFETPVYTTQVKVMFAVASALAIMVAYYWVNATVSRDEQMGAKPKKTKTKLSLAESAKMIFSSRYLGLIALLIIGYSISTNLVEGAWKAKIKTLYPTADAYQGFMGSYQKILGIGTMVFMIIGSNILRTLSWYTAAIITPIMFLVTSVAFFAFIIFDHQLSAYIAPFFAGGSIAFAVMLGTWQQVLGKGTKYSLFDPTKEMAYIPLDVESQTKGKAAVDVIGGRLGKSGGAVIQAIAFSIPGVTFDSGGVPIFAAICIVVIMLWIYAVSVLNTEYNNKLAEQAAEGASQ